MFNLLLADDESIVRRGIKTLVDYAALGIGEVFEAENGEQALEIVRRGDVHIVFADINMPRMNGLEFAKKAREIDGALKIALITGYDYFDYVLTALKLGVDDYILKPVSRDDVTELLIKLVDKRKAEDGQKTVIASADKIAGLATADDDSLKHTLATAIEQNLPNPAFSLSGLAGEIGYNAAYLSTLFKKLFGANFRDYLLDMRLEKAKILLLSTQMKNYEVASAIGIDDPNYLSALFKRKFGATVSEFRKAGGRL
jgi:two-component system, response regulator YesN